MEAPSALSPVRSLHVNDRPFLSFSGKEILGIELRRRRAKVRDGERRGVEEGLA